MLKFFRLPFATTGDKTAVPDAVDSNGNVSYSQGYGFDYQRQKTDPAAKNIERDKMNQVFFDMTTAIAELQSQGVPDFITTALNGGTAYSYAQYAVVKYSGDLYISLVAANTALPSDATKWALLPTPARIQAAFNSSAVAAGTADALTGAFSPAIAALPAAPGTLSVFVRAGAANATTTPTFKADGTTAKTIVKGANQALVAGDIAGAGHWLELQYDATLDKWVLQNPAFGITAQNSTVQGAFKNLKISCLSGVPNTNAIITADEVVLEDTGNAYVTARAVNVTVNSTASGANGLDTGTLAASTWYAVWLIRKPDGTTAGLFSLSATAPTMPSGYTFKARLGWVRTDASGNKYLLQTLQLGRRAQYVVTVATNTAAMPKMASGVAGTVATPVWVAVATGNFVPVTASEIEICIGAPDGTSLVVVAAPNNSYGTYNSTTNPPPVGLSGPSGLTLPPVQGSLILETSNIYWISSLTNGALYAAGWIDNI